MADEIKMRVSVEAQEAKAQLEQLAQSEAKLVQQTEATGKASDAAGRSVQERSARLREMKDRLTVLMQEEGKYHQAVAQGQATTAADQEASRQRQRQISELAGTLRQEERVQEAATDATLRGTQANRQAADALDDVNKVADQQHGVMDRLGGMVQGVATRVLAAAAVFQFFKSLIEGVRDSSRQAEQAMGDMGEAMRGLSANLGGQADPVFGQIRQMAMAQKLGTEGQKALIAGAGTLTDLRPELTQPGNMPELTARIQELAKLRALSGQGGEELAKTVLAMEEGRKLSHADAAQQTGVLLSSGFDPQLIQDIARRAPELLPAILGAREHNLNLDTAGRQLPSLKQALDRMDKPTRAKLGIPAGLGPEPSIMRLGELLEQGQLTEAKLSELTGGERLGELLRPLLAARQSGAIDRARAELQGTTLQDLRGQQQQSSFFRSREEQLANELRAEQAKESSALGNSALLEEFARSEMARWQTQAVESGELGRSGAWLGMKGFQTAMMLGTSPRAAASRFAPTPEARIALLRAIDAKARELGLINTRAIQTPAEASQEPLPASEAEAVRQAIEKRLKESEEARLISQGTREAKLESFDYQISQGASPEEAAKAADLRRTPRGIWLSWNGGNEWGMRLDVLATKAREEYQQRAEQARRAVSTPAAAPEPVAIPATQPSADAWPAFSPGLGGMPGVLGGAASTVTHNYVDNRTFIAQQFQGIDPASVVAPREERR